jgi:hypothetical protein
LPEQFFTGVAEFIILKLRLVLSPGAAPARRDGGLEWDGIMFNALPALAVANELRRMLRSGPVRLRWIYIPC